VRHLLVQVLRPGASAVEALQSAAPIPRLPMTDVTIRTWTHNNRLHTLLPAALSASISQSIVRLKRKGFTWQRLPTVALGQLERWRPKGSP
jgi:hypothetical protein